MCSWRRCRSQLNLGQNGLVRRRARRPKRTSHPQTFRPLMKFSWAGVLWSPAPPSRPSRRTHRYDQPNFRLAWSLLLHFSLVPCFIHHKHRRPALVFKAIFAFQFLCSHNSTPSNSSSRASSVDLLLLTCIPWEPFQGLPPLGKEAGFQEEFDNPLPPPAPRLSLRLFADFAFHSLH